MKINKQTKKDSINMDGYLDRMGYGFDKNDDLLYLMSNLDEVDTIEDIIELMKDYFD